MNKVILMGNLKEDPTLTYTPTGKEVCKFVLAIPDKFNPKDRSKVFWPRCVAWGKLATVIAEHCTKGQKILVGGRIVQNTYEKNGSKVTSWEITVDEFEFTGHPSSREDRDFDVPF